MWFRKLDYPRAQTYAIPYLTECFYAGSVILIVILVALNIALVGNDVVAELKKNPNNTDTKWWAPSWLPGSMAIPSTPGPCQPLSLPQHATSIRTNSTLPIFAYTILNGLGVSRKDNQTAKWYDALPYRSEPLQSCTVQNMTALINFQDRGIQLTSQITCNIQSENPETPPVLKLSTTFSRMANTDLGSDDIVDYISSYAVPVTADISKAQAVLLTNTPALKMLGVLDAVGSDLLKALWAQKWAWKLSNRDNQWPDQAVVKWSNKANCTSDERCRLRGSNVEGIDSWYSNTRGSQVFDPPYFRPMNTTMYNYFVVLRDALLLDLGNIDNQNNVFLDWDAFKARVLRDPFMANTENQVVGKQRPDSGGSYTYDQFWRTCTWGWGCYNGTWTEALLNNASQAINITNGLPLQLQDSAYPTVIDVDYVCPVFRAKQTGQMLVSVFIGTFSMYTALFGIFAFVAPIFDERYRKKHGLRRLSLDDEEDHIPEQYHHLAYPYQTPPHSSNPYQTIFDAPDLRHHSADAVPRYDPVPEPVFNRSSRKDDPGGNYRPASIVPPSDGPLPPISHVSTLSLSRSDSSSTRVSENSGNSVRATWDSSANQTPVAVEGQAPPLVLPVQPGHASTVNAVNTQQSSTPPPRFALTPPGLGSTDAESSTLLVGYFEPNRTCTSAGQGSESGEGMEQLFIAPAPARSSKPSIVNREGLKVGNSLTANVVLHSGQTH